MHSVHDENGNPIPHGHGGEFCHGHDHEHAHDHGPMETKDQMAALLDYMLRHNKSHAAELDKMTAKLAAENIPEAAEQVRQAVYEYTKGNLYLSLALSSVKEA